MANFDLYHKVPHEGRYQILSRHNRTAAAKRAGFKQIPAWVREMEDETAFMQLVLANAQGALSPLERGKDNIRDGSYVADENLEPFSQWLQVVK